MKFDKDSLLYEQFHYSPLVHNEEAVTKYANLFLKSLDNSIVIYPPEDQKTFLGLEVEVEGLNLNALESNSNEFYPLWSVKKDGSLRNYGMEFVSVPIRGKNILIALKMLEQHLKLRHPKHEFSERTSVHVHVNIRKLSVEQMVVFLFVYLSVEKSIFQFIKSGGWDRSNNIFCVALSESDIYVGMHNIMRHMNEGDMGHLFEVVLQMWRKYTAFNTLPMKDYGTFEFRHMGGTIDYVILERWINIILKLKKYSETHDLKSVIKTITDLNVNSQYEMYLEDIFGQYAHLVSTGDIHHELEEGVCSVKDILLWSNTIKQYPKTINELMESSGYRLLHYQFDVVFDKTNITELKKELDKLVLEFAAVMSAATSLGKAAGKDPAKIEEKLEKLKYAEKIQERINEIEILLDIRPLRPSMRRFKNPMIPPAGPVHIDDHGGPIGAGPPIEFENLFPNNDPAEPQ